MQDTGHISPIDERVAPHVRDPSKGNPGSAPPQLSCSGSGSHAGVDLRMTGFPGFLVLFLHPSSMEKRVLHRREDDTTYTIRGRIPVVDEVPVQ